MGIICAPPVPTVPTVPTVFTVPSPVIRLLCRRDTLALSKDARNFSCNPTVPSLIFSSALPWLVPNWCHSGLAGVVGWYGWYGWYGCHVWMEYGMEMGAYGCLPGLPLPPLAEMCWSSVPGKLERWTYPRTPRLAQKSPNLRSSHPPPVNAHPLPLLHCAAQQIVFRSLFHCPPISSSLILFSSYRLGSFWICHSFSPT